MKYTKKQFLLNVAKIVLATIPFFTIIGCNEDSSKNKGESMELVYSAGNTNLSTHIYKIKIDSVIYIVVFKREGIAIIKHGTEAGQTKTK